jgi:hypothetical protein
LIDLVVPKRAKEGMRRVEGVILEDSREWGEEFELGEVLKK